MFLHTLEPNDLTWLLHSLASPAVVKLAVYVNIMCKSMLTWWLYRGPSATCGLRGDGSVRYDFNKNRFRAV